MRTAPVIEPVERWYRERGWSIADFQRRAWDAYLSGRSGLIHAPTGTGKTYAAWLGPVLEALAEPDTAAPRLRVVWITPLRALANDTCASLCTPLAPLGLDWSVELRTGDTSSSAKARQRKTLPHCLVTTPESLTILLSYPDAARLFSRLRAVVVDEWHELLGTKRGVQTELALARLRALTPSVRTWGVSATLGNTEQAAEALLGSKPENPPVLIRGESDKRVEIETLIPDEVGSYPWSGHIGVRLADKVIERIERARTTLIFTNTRSQAEIWFREIVRRRPDLIGKVALHHGSLDHALRTRIEGMLRGDGSAASELRCVVATSSLDLGVDFSPVDQVIQIGSPKGVARLVQRAGRSGHQPGAVSTIVGVPTHALELVEYAAARDAVGAGSIETREPIDKPLDVLTQHLVTMSMPDAGFDPAALEREVRSTYAYRNLSDDEWAWALGFVTHGGPALTAYPQYARVVERGERRVIASPQLGRIHRINIGTITADEAVAVRYANGRTLGTVEESFVSRLRVGDRFVFAGLVVELEKLRGLEATVRRAKSARGAVPRWHGGRMPLSSQLAEGMLARLARADDGVYDAPEMEAARPMLELQKQHSRLPTPGILLTEQLDTTEGRHFFVYPFAGRLAHEGLAPVLALRLSRLEPVSVRATPNDAGIELNCANPIELDEERWRAILSPEGLVEDLVEAINAGELARRQFREIARIAGLTRQGFPGRKTPGRHLQASSDMFYEVFEQFDASNLLLDQARREVIEGQLEVRRLRAVLERASRLELAIEKPGTLTPMSFPLFAESIRATTLSSEAWEDRVRSMVVSLERGG